MDSRGVRGTGHPQVFIDGGGGDDVTVHRGHSPVAVLEGRSNHEPGSKAQKQGKGFHARVHASLDYLSRAGRLWCAAASAPQIQRPGGGQLESSDAFETYKSIINSKEPTQDFLDCSQLCFQS